MSFDGPTFGAREEGTVYTHRPGAYALIRDEDRRLAVVATPRGGFLPGGGRRPGETPERTVSREVREECGFDVVVVRELGRAREYVRAEGEGHFLTEAVFCECRAAGPGPGRDREPDHELGWIPVPKAVQVLTPRSHAYAAARFAVPLEPSTIISLPRQLEVRDLHPIDVPACEAVLRALPEWFGMESSIVEYVASLARLPGYVARLEDAVVGFAAVERPFPASAELHVIAVRPEYHGRGVGRALVDRVASVLRSAGVQLLYVKTLGPSHPDPHYARTRRAYERLGFLPLDESEREWGRANPCLRLVKHLRPMPAR